MSEDTLPLFDHEIEAKFEAYHAAHPEVYAKLRDFALAAKRSGRVHLGINMIHERVRWYTAVEAREDGEPWKLNNNYRPYYARLLMQQEPELAGFFETRIAKADDELRVEVTR